jgi:hypothetical protein
MCDRCIEHAIQKLVEHRARADAWSRKVDAMRDSLSPATSDDLQARCMATHVGAVIEMGVLLEAWDGEVEQ